MSGQRAEQRQFLPSSLNEQVSVLFGIGIFGFLCHCLYLFRIWDMWRLWELRRISVFANTFHHSGVVSFKREFTCRPLTRLSNHNSSFKREIYTAHETFLCCVANLRGVDNEGRLLYWLLYHGFSKNSKQVKVMSLSKKALKEQYDITSLSGSEYEPFSDGTEDSEWHTSKPGSKTTAHDSEKVKRISHTRCWISKARIIKR